MDQIIDALPDSHKRRRNLLPLWIKIFLWIFLVLAALVPIALILGVLGFRFSLSLFALETTEVFSPIGLLVLGLFTLKGIVAWALWSEKSWAITLGQLDATLSIIICLIMTFVDTSGGFRITIRLELVALIPYLIKLGKIKKEWLQLER